MKKRLFPALLVLLALLLAVPFLARWGEKRFLYPRPYRDIVSREAAEFGLEEDLVYAVIKTESGFREDVESRAGARGLMQLTPQTFDWIASLYPPEQDGAIDDPATNIHCGCALLRLLLDQYGSLDVALCAYNAGMGNVDRWLADEKYSADGDTLHTVPYPETKSYVNKVENAMARYEKLYG